MIAVINTTQGSFEVELFEKIAPQTVENFANLAKSGFYNNVVWHRIVRNFVIQTGDPTSRNGAGNPTSWGATGSNPPVPLEANSSTVAQGAVNNEGYLGIARGPDPNSGSSQFFVNLSNNNSLDGQYTVFGKVVKGMEIVKAIGSIPVNPMCERSGGMLCQPIDPKNAMVLGITIRES
jgi:cyclophilin family peptidyl-prolyl cis-trans isomerase